MKKIRDLKQYEKMMKRLRGLEMEKHSIAKIFEGSVIGAILLAVAFGIGPRFSRAQGQGRIQQLTNNLRKVRVAIHVYQADHEGLFPGQDCSTMHVDPEQFVHALTSKSDSGRGPYLSEFPANPYVIDSQSQKTITIVHDTGAVVTGLERTAWWFNTATGEFLACDSTFHANY